jgi:hypothetical protein
MPELHVSDKLPNDYANTSNSMLKIMSVPTSLMVEFPAFLTDFSQQFDSTWNTEDVFGRMDPIATYQGTKRTISLGFDIPAASREGARENLKKCQKLVQMVYPVYNTISNSKILSKPPLVRIQFANLIGKTVKPPDATQIVPNVADDNKDNTATTAVTKNADGEVSKSEIDFNERTVVEGVITQASPNTSVGLLGWISGLSWKPALEMGMFTGKNELLPKVVSISFSFNVLHEKTLSQDDKSLKNWPFNLS